MSAHQTLSIEKPYLIMTDAIVQTKTDPFIVVQVDSTLQLFYGITSCFITLCYQAGTSRYASCASYNCASCMRGYMRSTPTASFADTSN